LLTIMIMNGCWLIVLLCLYSGLHFVSFIKSFLCFHIKISLYFWEESIHIIHAYLLHAAKMHKSWVYVHACIHVTTTQVKIRELSIILERSIMPLVYQYFPQSVYQSLIWSLSP
jgi:hypothetical protein